MNPGHFGVKLLGSGSAVPAQIITNTDIARMVDTSDQWILQRTGIRERRKCDAAKGEGVVSLSVEAMNLALEEAGVKASDLDLLIVGSVTGPMTCPSTACLVANQIGCQQSGAFDVLAACAGFVYGLNIADSLVRVGRFKTVGVIGCDTLTTITDYSNRKLCVLTGDAAGAVVLQRTDDPSIGCLHQTLGADGSHWSDLYIPRQERDAPVDADWNEVKLGYLQMNGPEVYKFAISKFQEVLTEMMEVAGITVDDLKMLVAHQSNGRIIEATKRRLNLTDEKVYVNIDRYGNTSSGSVPLCLDELRKSGRIGDGDLIILLGFGGGLTWAASLWRL